MKQLIEQLERLSGRKVILTEMPGAKELAVVEYLRTHPGATEKQISTDVWGPIRNQKSNPAAALGIRRALRNGSIRRDETQRPIKYYVAGQQVTPQPSSSEVVPQVNKSTEPSESTIPLTGPKKTYDEYVKIITDYLKAYPGIAVKELFNFFPTQISAVPVLQKMLKTGLIVKDANQRPALWYVKGMEPAGSNTTIQPKQIRVGNVKELLKQIASDLEYFRPDGKRGNDIDINENLLLVSKDFRYLGRWEDDEEDGQEEYEDNDHRIWAHGEYKKYFNMFKEWAKKHSWYNKVELRLDTSEKDWCYFEIRIKK